MSTTTIKLHQDGADFYDESGKLVFRASIHVSDFDLAAAIAAREECQAQIVNAVFE